jgi:hypothetical protein
MSIILGKAEFISMVTPPTNLPETITKLELLATNYNNLVRNYNILVMHLGDKLVNS